MRPGELEAHVAAVRDFLSNRGLKPEHLILGILDSEHHDDGYHYDTHVGATDDQDLASLLSLVVGDISNEAQRQAVALVGSDDCPACGSPRFGPHSIADPADRYVVIRRNRCMDCEHVVVLDT